mgnify:FL=1
MKVFESVYLELFHLAVNNSKSLAEGGFSLQRLSDLHAALDASKSLGERRKIFVNYLLQLLPCDQVILWAGETTPIVASGIRELDRNSPYIHDLRDLYCTKLRLFREGALLSSDTFIDLPALNGISGGIYQPLKGVDGGVLLLRGDAEFNKAQLSVLGLINRTVHGDIGVRKYKFSIGERLPQLRSFNVFVVSLVIFLLVALFIPVSQTILSPIEIVSSNIAYIKPPVNGVIDEIFVEPGDFVQPGDLLITLDTAQLRAQLNIATSERDQLRIEYEQETIKSLSEANSRLRLAQIRSDLEEKQAQIVFLSDQVENHSLLAPRDGFVSMPETGELLGRPVNIGETLLTVSDPTSLEVELWIPLQTSLPVAAGDPMSVFLNSNPVAPFTATVRYVAIQPQLRPDSSISYNGRADFSSGETVPSSLLGQQGVARITTGEETLFMKLLRQPIAWSRKMFGI